ncbi:hypothetical protein [Streptomyces sp. SID5910]|uniref:hypothetical protein n=1 Tax=Streptomyces sp. SID5910 TaxID=2690312 RepID=UPI001369C918|nr:hypothetical protein [Streptomyces sp. SID5910]MYR43657.1 hypothetical protein [Streptomyces sp. SID5910]
MIFSQLLSAVFLMGLEQLVQSRYGAFGLLCLCVFGVGVRARSTTCASTGAVLFLLLMAQA